MRIERVSPAGRSDVFREPSLFRVRLWQRPRDENFAWMVDDWDIHDCADVREVLEWADAQQVTTYEVGVSWPDKVNDALGRVVSRWRFTRVAGRPGDEGSSKVEIFTAEA